MINGEHMLLPDTCSEGDDGYLSGTCIDEDAWNTAITAYAVGAGFIVVCLAACPAIGAGVVAAGETTLFGSGQWALASYCVRACVATLEVAGYGCGAVGLCIGPEVPGIGLAGTARDINPLGGANNCVACVIAFDASLTGAPAVALNTGRTQIRLLSDRFSSSWIRVGGEADVAELLRNAGPGSRGIVFGSRSIDNSVPGHVWTALNQEGVVRFVDPQTGRAAMFDGYTGYNYMPISSSYDGLFTMPLPPTWAWYAEQ